MSYDIICGRNGWSMGEYEFDKFLAGGDYLEDSAIRHILNAQNSVVDFPDRQTMDSTFLNSFEDIGIEAGYEAAANFARTSPMGKCQDRHVMWALPYDVQGVHWVTIVICRELRLWGIVDSLESLSQPSYPYIGDIVEALVSSIPVLEEPDKPWEFEYIWAQQQTDEWSCGIHTAENILYFLNGGIFSTEKDIDIGECYNRYLDAFIDQGHAHALANLDMIIAARSAEAIPTDSPTDATPVDAIPTNTPTHTTPTDEHSRRTKIKRELMAAKSKLSVIAKTENSGTSTPNGESNILKLSPTTLDLSWTALDPHPLRALRLDWSPPWEEVSQPQASNTVDSESPLEVSQPQSPTSQDSNTTDGMEWIPIEQESQPQPEAPEAPRGVAFNWGSSPPQAISTPVDIPIEINPSPTPQPPTWQPFKWRQEPQTQPQPPISTRFIQPVAFNRTPPSSGPQLHLQIPQPIPFNDFGFGIGRRSTHKFQWSGSNARPFLDSPSRRRHQPLISHLGR